MDEVELPEDTRDARTGLRRLAPEIEAARDKIIDHFEDKPFAELREFVQKLLEIEEDETKRLGALAARVYLLRKRVINFEESVEFIPADELSAELDVPEDETSGRSWARVRVLENCEVNGMRLPQGIIVDVSAADAERLIDAGHAEMHEAADPEILEEDSSHEDNDATDTDDDIAEEIEDAADKDIEAEPADETIVEEAPETDDDADVPSNTGDADPDAQPLAAAESAGDSPEADDADEAKAELLDTEDHALATAIAETAEAFKEIDAALAAESTEEQAAGLSEDDEGDEEADET